MFSQYEFMNKSEIDEAKIRRTQKYYEWYNNYK